MPEVQKTAPVVPAGLADRRRGRRFGLRLSCRVYPLLMEQAEFEGSVVNISRSGVLVALDSPEISSLLAPDGIVRVVVSLPRHPWFTPRYLEIIGGVVRVVLLNAQTQVAVEIRQIRVTDQSDAGASINGWQIDGPIQ